MWRKDNPSALLVELPTGATTVENSVAFLQKFKMYLTFDPVIPLLGIYSKNADTPIQKNLCIPVFIAALSTIAKIWKQLICPTEYEWIKKLWYIYTTEYYAAEKNSHLLQEHG